MRESKEDIKDEKKKSINACLRRTWMEQLLTFQIEPSLLCHQLEQRPGVGPHFHAPSFPEPPPLPAPARPTGWPGGAGRLLTLLFCCWQVGPDEREAQPARECKSLEGRAERPQAGGAPARQEQSVALLWL